MENAMPKHNDADVHDDGVHGDTILSNEGKTISDAAVVDDGAVAVAMKMMMMMMMLPEHGIESLIGMSRR
jgi:hypothetical protein